MEVLWSLRILVFLLSVHVGLCHEGPKGLSCVNDFVNKVSCTWNGSPKPPGVNCSISSVKTKRIASKTSIEIFRSCKLEQHGSSPPGCSFVFDDTIFSRVQDRPMHYIKLNCNGTLVENITNYKPKLHVKMNPPGAPTVNDTWISWTAGSPKSMFILAYDFQVQVKQKSQPWEKALLLSTEHLHEKIPSWKLKGNCEVRVRVYPAGWRDCHWSDWSPVTSWISEEEGGDDNPQFWEWLLNPRSLVILGVTFIFGLIFVVMLVLNRCRINKGLHKKKSVPNPSIYFHTLHSVHGGNLKKWLNPLSAPESFFTTQPCDHISPVELCESPGALPSTCALLHYSKSFTSAGSDTSGIPDNSCSSSSSGFCNMGYFLSSSSGSSTRTDPNPAYFTYQEEIHNLHNSHGLHLSLCPSVTPCPVYESLRREPQSPDSGFGIGKEDEENKEAANAVDEEGRDVAKDHHTSPLLILPLPLPSQMCPSASPPLPPSALTQGSPDSQQADTLVVVPSSSYAAWPVAGAMCRSSSMPVETSRPGYLTLKELQTTFSNKSI